MGARSSKNRHGHIRVADPQRGYRHVVAEGFQRSKSASKLVGVGSKTQNCDFIRTPSFIRASPSGIGNDSKFETLSKKSKPLQIDKIKNPCDDASSTSALDNNEFISDKENGHQNIFSEAFTLVPTGAPFNFSIVGPDQTMTVEQPIESESWFFGRISRKESEKVLMRHEIPRGGFLIRNSEQNCVDFALCLKNWDPERWFHIQHYRIHRDSLEGQDGLIDCYYITRRLLFSSIGVLVKSYSENAQGLCHVLTMPCPKPVPLCSQRQQTWELFLSPPPPAPAENEIRDRDEWEIDPNELKFVRKLGSGYFGDVWYGHWRNGTEVAIKSLKSGGHMSSIAFRQEAGIMKKFQHSNLVTLYAVCSGQGSRPGSEPTNFYIVTEYMRNGSLLDYLRIGDGKHLEEPSLVYIAEQIASGMAYLEDKQLVHRDLAARNVLIGDQNIAKICDFGLARVIVQDGEYCSRQDSRFPVKWTAPDAVQFMRFTVKSDVWSYGILLMELFTYGQVPYPGMSNREVIDQVSRGYRMLPPSTGHVPDAVYNIMLRCWDAVPERRPTFDFLQLFFQNFTHVSNNYVHS